MHFIFVHTKSLYVEENSSTDNPVENGMQLETKICVMAAHLIIIQTSLIRLSIV